MMDSNIELYGPYVTTSATSNKTLSFIKQLHVNNVPVFQLIKQTLFALCNSLLPFPGQSSVKLCRRWNLWHMYGGGELYNDNF